MKKAAFAFCILIGSSVFVGLGVESAMGQAVKNAPPKSAFAPPTDAEIAAARSKGLVWTNPTTKVYHKGGEFYGKTTSGKFMSEADAIRQYYRPSPDAMKKASSTAMPPPGAKAAAPLKRK